MTARRLIGVTIVALAVLAWLYRVQLTELVLTAGGLRFLLHHAGWRIRRRPKSSYAKLMEGAAFLIAAWSTRGLLEPRALRRKPVSW